MASPFKWLAIGLGVTIGVGHIGVLGHLARNSSVPNVAAPQVNDFSSYRITATRDGYTVEYIGNDPRVLTNDTEVDSRPGFLGIGGSNRTRSTREFTQDGSRNLDGGVDEEGKLSAEDIACIEAAGGGRSSGAIVGGSVAAAAAPSLISIPYVGWLAAGWATILGTDVGGDLGAGAAQMIQGC